MFSSLFERAKEIFRDPQDQAELEAEQKNADELEKVQSFLDKDEDKVVQKFLINRISDTIRLLDEHFKNGDNAQMLVTTAQLSSLLSIYDKLNVSGELDAIKAALTEKINNPYG